MHKLALLVVCLAYPGHGQQDSISPSHKIPTSLETEDALDRLEHLAELLLSSSPATAFNPSIPVTSNFAADHDARSAVSMSQRPQLKAAKWAAAKRPRKTRPYEINTKPAAYRKDLPPIPDIPWITPTGKKVDKLVLEEELPKMGMQIQTTRGIQKTWFPKAADVAKSAKKWWIVDATGLRLGRMASEIAQIVLGKSKIGFTPGALMGDYVIVINAEKVIVTGKKMDQKLYRRHTTRPGSMKIETFRQLQKRIPERIIEKAIVGMLPKNSHGKRCFGLVKVFKGPEHPHEAQNPTPLTFGGLTSTPDYGNIF